MSLLLCLPTPVPCSDEVQDFTQAELLIDLKIVADPNGLFLSVWAAAGVASHCRQIAVHAAGMPWADAMWNVAMQTRLFCGLRKC